MPEKYNKSIQLSAVRNRTLKRCPIVTQSNSTVNRNIIKLNKTVNSRHSKI